MFNEHYTFHKANIERPISDKYLICTHNYTFKTEKTQYIAKVEQYIHNIYIIKFFRKQDKNRKNRYSLLTNERKCTRIVSTCIHILISILKNDELASFGFLGANTVTKEYEEGKSDTKRFRIYKQAMENLIGDKVFAHSMDKQHSTYLMVNRKNVSVEDFTDQAKLMFDDIFPQLSE
ncbi:hypothetical protein [Mucilaginibacter pedocola]|uniref:Uncharacterized protein n=1 Tax=Mucilaginibacter pedocola TaxID=1792845 RepID=A0A1S9PJN0_9SPHI|nr:hypothetical protein [Mucilaginibacter pedocola]OOQ61162.1 hypothetical protein BC343_22230 [Mucilaginibacter pedocola]